MAVYTKVEEGNLRRFLEGYELGALTSYEGISKGVSNTNYHLFTDQGRFILTLFESRRVGEDDLPFFFDYADHLARNGISVPTAIPNKDGKTIGRLSDRPAVILSFLEGEDVPFYDLTPDHCRQVGALLAEMHVAVDGFKPVRENSIGIDHWPTLCKKVVPFADDFEAGLGTMLVKEIDYLQKNWPHDLPIGAVHADVFPDNVFFDGDKLCAVIDFYFASTDYFAFDLAICMNAWCFDKNYEFSKDRWAELITAYERVRGLNDEERAHFQTLCRGAAFRTLISRLEEYFEHDPEKTLMEPHDPKEYLEKLRFHQDHDLYE